MARFSLASGSSDLAHRRPIELLHEYRTRLIADVVTGKLDTRTVETNLPDGTEGHDPVVPADDIINKTID